MNGIERFMFICVVVMIAPLVAGLVILMVLLTVIALSGPALMIFGPIAPPWVMALITVSMIIAIAYPIYKWTRFAK